MPFGHVSLRPSSSLVASGSRSGQRRQSRPRSLYLHPSTTPAARLRSYQPGCPGRAAGLPRSMGPLSCRAAEPDTPLPSAGNGGAVSDEDRHLMRRAMELASRGVGKTHPNPAVGSVIVKDGQVVGEGFHPKAGMPHAEVYALRGAGNKAKGATAYVTLEPCNHFGRTPPCSRALVAAGVKRVVIGVMDPNPLVGGSGIQTLEAAGIQVDLVGGAEEAECYAMNKDFMDRMAAQAATTSATK